MGVYNPNIEVIVKNPLVNFLGIHAKALREHASGIVSIKASIEETNEYKQLLFDAAKLIDKASKILPEENPIVKVRRYIPWWCWLSLGLVLGATLYLSRVFFI